MRPIPLILASAVLLSLSMLHSPAIGAELPKKLCLPMLRELPSPGPAKIATNYVKKNTWHETLRASLEATFAQAAEGDRAAAGCDVSRPVIAAGTPEHQQVREAWFDNVKIEDLGR